MEDMPHTDAPLVADLSYEWQRITTLISLTEMVRAGVALPDEFEQQFLELQEQSNMARMHGAWAELRPLLGQELLEQLSVFDLDILAVVLAPFASPTLGPRMQALQPFLNLPFPAVPLVQELLMLDSAEDVSELLAHLAPTAPLIAGNVVRLEQQGAYLVLKPSAHTVRAILKRPAELGPPPGASLVECAHGWEALVLPARVIGRLQEFEAWVAGRTQVFEEWGGRHIGGPMALFSGASGVGKSFAATVLTRELCNATGKPWVLYRLDLGRIVSKYVGETEKNLNALLDALHGTHAVLQIDEADGLLGKRGEVSDARDRYANLEVSHMLSRFEMHDGPVILTTNLRSNIDAAFLRRFQVVVDFPAPDADMRADLWQRLLPKNAPLHKAVDIAALGASAPLPGGGIHNAAIYAAILAAKDKTAITQSHLATACWRELTKEARSVRRSELGILAEHLPEGEVQ